jgi:bifunctional non-homologous end joining protein LigD
MAERKKSIAVGGRRVYIRNPDKMMYPDVGMTKADVVDFYLRISEPLLAHVRNRAVTLKRYVDGVDGNLFYEKQCPKHRPEWMKTVPMRRKRDEKTIHYCLINNKAGLAWSANLANLELHTSLAKASDVSRPTSLVFDLDPGPPAGVLECGEVAFRLRDMFARLGLDVLVKTSGSKGLQAYVPLNTKVGYDATKPFAHAVALRLEGEHPDEVLSTMGKQDRTGKVFVDWSQNDFHKTTVSVYSLRARQRPTVSTPVTWPELSKAIASGDPETLTFECDEVLRRIDKHGDLFEPVRTLKQRLPALDRVSS